MAAMVMDVMNDANCGGVGIVQKHPQTFTVILIYYVLFGVLWAVVVSLLTASGQSSTYLSVQGTGGGQLCVEIPKVITASFEGDVFGNWVTSNNFKQNSSAFVVEFVGSEITTDQYVATMTSFKQQLLALSQKSARRDSGWNAMMWSTFILHDPVSQISFYSSADASMVYRGNTMLGCVSSVSGGVCPAASQQVHFDVGTNELVFTVKTAPVSDAQLVGFVNVSSTNTLPIYPLVDWVYNAPWQDACPLQYPSYNWSQWEPSAQNNVMAVNFDIRTIVNVMSVNLAITSLSTFVKVSSAFGIDVSGGIKGSFYYDSFCKHILHTLSRSLQCNKLSNHVCTYFLIPLQTRPWIRFSVLTNRR